MMTAAKPEGKRVVIVGAGFAGLNAAKELGRHGDFAVTLIDRRNYHLFQPLLYQVATAALSPAEIAVPIRIILRSCKRVRVLLGVVLDVDTSASVVNTDFGPVPYDHLLLACGAQHSYFGHGEWEDSAPGLKTLEQATEIRRRVFLAFEQAERESDSERQRKLLTFIIVGGGPTGVELAGALGEISRHTLSRDFRNIDPRVTRVILIEAGPRILPSFDGGLSRQAARKLEKLGVTVWTSVRVTGITPSGVALGDEFVQSATVLWAAGVAPSELNRNLAARGAELDRQGRVKVGEDLSVPAFPNVFVVGDQACFTLPDGSTAPGLAPTAIQQGLWAARNILADGRGEPRRPFRFKDKGQLATVGRAYAVAQMGKSLRFRGFPAWLLWTVVHIYYLIGFKNRLFVLLQWTLAYLSYSRGARLIVNKEWKSAIPSPLKSSTTTAGSSPSTNPPAS